MAGDQKSHNLLPSVGSEAYRRLAFKDQLEIASLQLFNPDEYARRTGEAGVASPSFGLPALSLTYPSQPPFHVEDLPVAVLHKYWAGYVCSYREEWYFGVSSCRGLSPLDIYDFEVGKLANIRTFNFSLLALERSFNNIFGWVVHEFYSGVASDSALLDACKIYTYMAHYPIPMKRGIHDEPDPLELYRRSLNAYQDIVTFDELNEHFPIIEPCEELEYVECGEFTLISVARIYRGSNRYFYPIIPSLMYSTTHFHIRRWDFVDPR